MGYFHALKWAFLSSLIRKYMLWEGFYHDFSTKKVSGDPEVTSPPLMIYPGAAPGCKNFILKCPVGQSI